MGIGEHGEEVETCVGLLKKTKVVGGRRGGRGDLIS